MPKNLTQTSLNGKHVVVFGAGYVGGAVAAQAISDGARVTTVTRNPETCTRLRNLGCDAVAADLESPVWHDQVPPPDFVLNSVSSGRQGLEGYQRSYLDGARSIMAWARAFDCRNIPLIYTSSTSVYPQDGGIDVDESMPAEAEDERGRLLLAAEGVVGKWLGPSVILRLAGIYGPGRHHLLDSLKSSPSQVAGEASHHLNLIHRDDIVRAVLANWGSQNPPELSVYNVVDDGRATRSQIVEWLAQQLGVPVPIFSGISVPGRRATRPDRIIVNDKLKSERGWRPHYPTFKEGYVDLLLDA